MPTDQPSILFVCTGNLCRSPMAKVLFRAQLQKARADWQSWIIDSAGTWTNDNEPASTNAVTVMQQRGLELADHRSKILTAKLINDFDLILVMEPNQKEAIQIEFPQVAKRVFVITEMENGYPAILRDPYGRSVEHYEETAKKLEKIFSIGMERIFTLVDARHPKTSSEIPNSAAKPGNEIQTDVEI